MNDAIAVLRVNVPATRAIKFKTLHADIRSVHRGAGVAFVSPANSFGSMGGGIDAVYRGMWPGIERTVMEAIAALPTKTDLVVSFDGLPPMKDKPYLPIGQAMITPVSGDAYLITAPTMVQPMAVHETQNAYLAMRAVLDILVAHGGGIHTLVVPGLCTEVGCMLETESARQITDAIKDYL